MMKTGEQCSRNFVLNTPITSIPELLEALNNFPSLYFFHRIYPSSFIHHQPLTVLEQHIKYGNIWTVTKVKDVKQEEFIKKQIINKYSYIKKYNDMIDWNDFGKEDFLTFISKQLGITEEELLKQY